MRLLELNDDVLHCIVSTLHGPDALNLSFTARRAHDIAIHRVAAVVECRDGRELRLLHRYMFSGTRPRAQYMESLVVSENAYMLDGNARSRQLASRAEPLAWDQVRLVVDLLLNAANLRDLVLPLLHPTLQYDPRLVHAIGALPSLTSAAFGTVGGNTLALLRGFSPQRLRNLNISFYPTWKSGSYRQEAGPVTFSALLNTLASFPFLQTLRLEFFRSTPSFQNLGHESKLPLLPSLRSLMLQSVYAELLDLVPRCPNLMSLEYTIPGADSDIEPAATWEGARWPPLHSLQVWDASSLLSAKNLVTSVHHLEIRDRYPSSPEDEASLPLLLDAIRVASPVGMCLSLRLDADIATFWTRAGVLAPNLRFLQLGLPLLSFPWPPPPKYYGLWDAISDALRPLRLVALRILLSRVQYPAHARGGTRTDRECIDAVEAARARAATTLPQRLAEAIPSLRFVSICKNGPDPVAECPVRGSDGAEEGEATHSGSGEWKSVLQPEDELERGHGQSLGMCARFRKAWFSSRRWYRVRVDGDDVQRRRLEEVSEKTGDRVLSFLEDAPDVETVSRIEEFFP